MKNKMVGVWKKIGKISFFFNSLSDQIYFRACMREWIMRDGVIIIINSYEKKKLSTHTTKNKKYRNKMYPQKKKFFLTMTISLNFSYY